MNRASIKKVIILLLISLSLITILSALVFTLNSDKYFLTTLTQDQDILVVDDPSLKSSLYGNVENNSFASFPSIRDVDPEATDCHELLDRFRKDVIEIAKTRGEDFNFKRSFVTISSTDKPFYVATHDPKVDNVRSIIMKTQKYYERELTKRIAEVFDDKKSKGEKSIMLDVGANIGWFSLVAAAHGATKIYSFEPNLQNTIRFCESLSLNHYFLSNGDRKQEDDIVIPISKGLGNVEQSRKFYAQYENNPGSFTFQDVGEDKVLDTLNITTLDAFAERHGWFDSRPNIGFFKLDVENFELEVLEGAEKLLKSRLIEKIALEMKPEQDAERKLNILRHLFHAGYEIYMHGKFMGPGNIVEKTYNLPEELSEDLKNYGENLLFRLKNII